MNKTASDDTRLPSLLKRLQGLTAHPPPERLRDEIARLVEDIADQGAGDESFLCEAALLVAGKASTATEEELRDFYLALLPGLGPLAAPLALAIAAQLPPDPKKGPSLETVAEELRLEAVNLALQCTRGEFGPVRSAALKELPAVASRPAKVVRTFLADCLRRGRTVAHPLAEALLAGPYGEDMDKVLNKAAKDIAAGSRPGKGLATLIDLHAPLVDQRTEAKLLPLLGTKQASVLTAVLRLLGTCCTGPSAKAAKAAAKLILHQDRAVAAAALEAFLARAPRDQGKLFAALLKKAPALRNDLLARAPLLRGAEYTAFTAAMGGSDKDLPAAIFASLIELDPEATLTNLEAAMGNGSAADAGALLQLVPATAPPDWADADAAEAAFKPRKKKKKDDKDKKKKDREGGFFSMFGGGSGGGASGGDAISVQFGDATVGDGVEEGGKGEHSGRKITPIYDARTLQRIDFSGAFLENAVFQKCTLVGVKFIDTLLRGTRFVECVFVDCDFSGARMYETTCTDLTMNGCSLRGVRMAGSRITMLDARQCDFRSYSAHGSTLRTCRMTACDLSGIQILDSDCMGVELLLSHCPDVCFDRSRLLCQYIEGCGFPNMGCNGVLSDAPVLMHAEDRMIAERARNLGVSGVDIPTLGHGAMALAADAVSRWFRGRDLRVQALAFLTANRRRIDWCCDKLGPDKAGFFGLAPFLLHSEVFEQHHEELEPLPLATRMAGYAVDYSTLEFARRFFPDAAPPQPQPDPILIEALYTIGSVGTVAQNVGSDLDYWVCYDPEDMPENLVDGLTDKLEHIEHWADQELGLEVHFFTMDLQSIRDNNFGFSDAESSGSAQALLLKEEFYRTAVCASGKAPLWWATPVGADDATYAAIRDDLASGRSADRFVDLGNLVRIPAEEFFGASLWQIVKALKSPFKSIMKFGLLEKYIASGDETGSLMLCDRLKQNLAQGYTSINSVDPYVLMFREVGGHYAQAKEKDSLNLVRLSFLLKTKIAEAAASGLTPMRREESEMLALAADPAMFPPGTLAAMDGSFAKLARVGALVNKFIVRTYMHVRDIQAKRKDSIAITPEDLTKLGRKIFATFSKRRHKIEHIPFLSIGGNSFQVLHFSASGKKMGQPSHWDIQGAQEVAGKDRLELADLRKGPDLVESLVWLTANGIYQRGMEVRGDYSISPVTAKDIQNLMDRLLDFFPSKKTFNTDIAEMLNPERIVKAFYVLNLVQPREQSTVTEASIVYSTNWGELFSVTTPVRDTTLFNNPAEFLLQNVEQEFDQPPVMDHFAPERASFPLPKL